MVASVLMASSAHAQTVATLGLGRLEGVIRHHGEQRTPPNALIEAVRLDAEPALSFRTMPDDRGRFRLDSLPAGRYMVQLASAHLDSLELSLQPNEKFIYAGSTSKADFDFPEGSDIRDAMCRGVKLGQGTGVVVGHGFDADTDMPLPNAKVVVSWREFKFDRGARKLGREERDGVVETGPNGEFRLCGVPTESMLTIQLQYRDRAGGVARVVVSEDDGAAVRNLSLSVGSAPLMTVLDSLERALGASSAGAAELNPAFGMTGTSAVSGIVRGSGNQPLADAEVRVANTSAVAVTDAAGRFTLTLLPPGTQVLFVRRIGYPTLEADLELRSGRTITRDVTLQRFASLDSIRIIGQRSRYAAFEANRKTNFYGKFFTSEEIQKREPGETTDLIMSLAGFTIAGFGPEAVVTSKLAKGNHPSCEAVNVVIDGVPRGGVNYVEPNQIAGIEIYRDEATAPAPWKADCGLIVIWTKRYRPKSR